MKNLLSAVLATAILFASCKKSSTTSTPTPTPTPTIPANGWKLGTTSYTTAMATKISSTTLSAFDGIPSGSSPAVNSCNLWFNPMPTASGTYRIVMYAGGVVLGSTQMGISAGLYATGTTYVSTGNDAIDATVTVTGGKIKVVIPNVWVKKTTTADSLQLTGTIIEN